MNNNSLLHDSSRKALNSQAKAIRTLTKTADTMLVSSDEANSRRTCQRCRPQFPANVVQCASVPSGDAVAALGIFDRMTCFLSTLQSMGGKAVSVLRASDTSIGVDVFLFLWCASAFPPSLS